MRMKLFLMKQQIMIKKIPGHITDHRENQVLYNVRGPEIYPLQKKLCENSVTTV